MRRQDQDANQNQTLNDEDHDSDHDDEDYSQPDSVDGHEDDDVSIVSRLRRRQYQWILDSSNNFINAFFFIQNWKIPDFHEFSFSSNRQPAWLVSLPGVPVVLFAAYLSSLVLALLLGCTDTLITNVVHQTAVRFRRVCCIVFSGLAFGHRRQ